MDAYCYALSTIKKLGYICDTLLYLTDFQPQLFSRRSSKSLIFNILIGAQLLFNCAPISFLHIFNTNTMKQFRDYPTIRVKDVAF